MTNWDLAMVPYSSVNSAKKSEKKTLEKGEGGLGGLNSGRRKIWESLKFDHNKERGVFRIVGRGYSVWIEEYSAFQQTVVYEKNKTRTLWWKFVILKYSWTCAHLTGGGGYFGTDIFALTNDCLCSFIKMPYYTVKSKTKSNSSGLYFKRLLL